MFPKSIIYDFIVLFSYLFLPIGLVSKLAKSWTCGSLFMWSSQSPCNVHVWSAEAQSQNLPQDCWLTILQRRQWYCLQIECLNVYYTYLTTFPSSVGDLCLISTNTEGDSCFSINQTLSGGSCVIRSSFFVHLTKFVFHESGKMSCHFGGYSWIYRVW